MPLPIGRFALTCQMKKNVANVFLHIMHCALTFRQVRIRHVPHCFAACDLCFYQEAGLYNPNFEKFKFLCALTVKRIRTRRETSNFCRAKPMRLLVGRLHGLAKCKKNVVYFFCIVGHCALTVRQVCTWCVFLRQKGGGGKVIPSPFDPLPW